MPPQHRALVWGRPHPPHGAGQRWGVQTVTEWGAVYRAQARLASTCPELPLLPEVTGKGRVGPVDVISQTLLLLKHRAGNSGPL